MDRAPPNTKRRQRHSREANSREAICISSSSVGVFNVSKTDSNQQAKARTLEKKRDNSTNRNKDISSTQKIAATGHKKGGKASVRTVAVKEEVALAATVRELEESTRQSCKAEIDSLFAGICGPKRTENTSEKKKQTEDICTTGKRITNKFAEEERKARNKKVRAGTSDNGRLKELKRQKKRSHAASLEEDLGLTQKNGDLRYTSDGLRIYTAEELHVGKGGGTRDCPFDCRCCF